MAKLVTLLEQHLDRQPPTVVIRVTTWREKVAHVKLQECGLGMNLRAKVSQSTIILILKETTSIGV